MSAKTAWAGERHIRGLRGRALIDDHEYGRLGGKVDAGVRDGVRRKQVPHAAPGPRLFWIGFVFSYVFS